METKPSSRIASIDIMRGVVMVLMAIDHVRVYAGVPTGPTPDLFFTRWVTHFCVPAFVFFAGTAAFFHGQRLGGTKALSRYLVTRGLMLVVLELTLIRFTWTFNLAFSQFMLAGVIWMLGWCMVLLAPLVRFRARTVGILGLAIALGQQVFGLIPRAMPDALHKAVGPWWAFFYTSGTNGPKFIAILYVLIPWIGVMAAGYGFGLIMARPVAERDKICVRLGLAMTALFLIVGSVVVLTSDGGQNPAPFYMRLLNQQKYPASQLYLFMTLGPMIALLPLAERATGLFAKVFGTFGRVPLFYYLLHIPAIHIAALIVGQIRDGAMHHEWYRTAPYASVPPDHRWSLGLLYLVFFVVVVLLYFACAAYARAKRERPRSWMQYV